MAARINLREYLTGGDRRSIGRSKELLELVQGRMDLLPQLLHSIWDSDPLVAMRAADAVEKITRIDAKPLQPFKKELLGLAAETGQQELRWHLALMVPRLKLGVAEQKRAVAIFMSYLTGKSALVKTFALQALFDLSRQNPGSGLDIEEILNTAARTGTPAMCARARILLKQLAKESRNKGKVKKSGTDISVPSDYRVK